MEHATVRHTSIVLPFNKRPSSDPSSTADAQDDDLGEETLIAKEPMRAEALARARARGNANAAADARRKDKGSGSLDRPRLFQNSLSEDDVTRLMPSTRDVAAVGNHASPSKPTMGEFARARPAAGRAVEIGRRSDDDELSTNVFDQPARGSLAQGRRAVLASPSKATLLEPAPGFMDGSDERATITNEQDSERTMIVADTGEREALLTAERNERERAKRAPAAFARVEPVSHSTAPHPFAPRPATPLAAQSGAVQAVALSEARIDAGTTVTASRPAVNEGRSMGAWAVAFAAVVLLVAGGAFAALKNPGAPSEAAVSLVDPLAKAAAAQPALPPAPQALPSAPAVVAPQALQTAPVPVAAVPVEPPVALPTPVATTVAVPPEPVASVPAKVAHHAAGAVAPPAPKPVAVAAPPAPKPVAAAAPPAPKPEKPAKKGKDGAMSDEEKKLSDEAKALADKQLQQSL